MSGRESRATTPEAIEFSRLAALLVFGAALLKKFLKLASQDQHRAFAVNGWQPF
jgi:hypothetical protein